MCWKNRFMLTMTVLKVFECASEMCKPFNLNQDYFNKRLVGHSFYTTVINLHDCARYCIYISACKSLNYDLSTDTCELNDIETVSANETEIETKYKTIVSDINNWPREIGSSCSTRLCSPHQLCIPTVEHQCMDIVCGSPPSVTNGAVDLVSPDRHFLLDQASVTCADGFVSNLSHIICKPPTNLKKATCVHVSNDKVALSCSIRGTWETPGCFEGVPPTTTTIACSINPGDYLGNLNTTQSGQACQRWDSQFPHSHDYTVGSSYPEGDISLAENHCRALGETFIWCFTTYNETRWEECVKPPDVC